MLPEVRWMFKFSVPFNIAGRCDGQNWRFDEVARNETREAGLSETYRKIDALGDQIADTLVGYKLDREFGITLAECAQAARQHHRQEEGIDVDLQAATDGGNRAGSDGCGILDRVEVRFHLVIEASTFVSQRHRSSRTIKQPNAKPGLQPVDGPAHAGISEADEFCGFDEAAAFDHGRQHTDPGQNPAIERHGSFLIFDQEPSDVTAFNSRLSASDN